MKKLPTKRILITGASGQVGQSLFEIYGANEKILYTDLIGANEITSLDITNANAVMETVRNHKPEIIINAAAYTAVDKAESEPDLAFAINCEAVKTLTKAANEVGAAIFHYSTDYVYSGEGEHWRTEDEPTGPQSVYGKSKLCGDEALLSEAEIGYVFRTSWVFSKFGHNFLKTMLRLGAERKELSIVSDQIGAPTSAEAIAEATVSIIEDCDKEELKQRRGLYHLCCSGSTSWHGFASKIFELSRQAGTRLAIEQVNPIPTADYPLPAKRPLNSRLDCSKLYSAFGVRMPSWEDETQKIIERSTS